MGIFHIFSIVQWYEIAQSTKLIDSSDKDKLRLVFKQH